MKPKLKLSQTILLSLVLLAPAAGAAPLLAQTDEETARAVVRTMSKEQLSGLYADAIVSGVLEKTGVTPENEARIRECVVGALDAEFTADEMRTMYLEPPDMDKGYYEGKMDAASAKILVCVKESVR
jgi:hypothetical protein